MRTMAICDKLLAPIWEAAKTRQRAGAAKGGKSEGKLEPNSAQATERAPQVRDTLADFANTGHSAAQEFLTVKQAAELPDAPEEIKALPAQLKAGAISLHAAASDSRATPCYLR
jgi:hypothetical protein